MRITVSKILPGFLFLMSMAHAQRFQEAPKTIPSPNVASLGTYGDIPVSLFTGVPQINIPLINANDGKVNIPVSLSYHAAGVKIDQRPGWTGLNFNLNVGGSITRQINDIPDDFVFNGQAFGYAFYSPSAVMLDTLAWSTYNYMKMLGLSSAPNFDTEPDEYTFNFMGYSGSFYLDSSPDRKWKVKSDHNFKVTLIPTSDGLHVKATQPPFRVLNGTPWFSTPIAESYPSHFAGFILTSEDGTQFIFGDTNAAMEYSIDFFNQDEDAWLATSWSLVKIIAVDGRETTFNYERGPFTNQMYYGVSFKIKKVDGTINSFGPRIFTPDRAMTPDCFSWQSGQPSQGFFNGKLISPIYLKEIVLSDGAKIAFTRTVSNELGYDKTFLYDPFNEFRKRSSSGKAADYRNFLCFLIYDQVTKEFDTTIPYADVFNSLSWQKLDMITFTNSHGKKVAEHAFEYKPDPAQRLMLQSLTSIDVVNQQNNQVHKFFYDESITLPPYLKVFTDHFGYYNGKATPTSIIDGISFYDLREPDPAYAKPGILNKIIYPTGGITEFEYEVNDYSKEVDLIRSNPLIDHAENKSSGGLRIKKMVSYDPKRPADKLTREYFYQLDYNATTGEGGFSSGILGGRAQYYWNDFKTVAVDDPNQVLSEEVLSSSSILPMSENSGSHIGYSQVIEKFSDGSVVIHKFTNFDNGHMDESPITSLQELQTPYEPYISKAFERGKLIGKEIYSKTGYLLESQTLVYEPIRKDSVRAIRLNHLFTCAGSFQSFLEGSSYKIYTYPFLLKSETSRRYDLENSQKYRDIVTTYTYNDQDLPREIHVTQSGNRELVTEITYPFDANGETDSHHIQAVEKLRERHMINTVIEKVVRQLPEFGSPGNGKIISQTRAKFKLNEANGNLPVTHEVLELEPGSQHLTSRIKFNKYDAVGNITEYTPVGGATVSFQYGYRKQFPVAKVENSKLTDFFYTSFEEGDGNSTEGDCQTGIKSKTDNFNTTLSGLSNGPYELSYWKKEGDKWQYHVDNSIIVSNTSYAIQLFGQIDEVRFHPLNAVMTTTSFRPHIGMQSTTDANGKTTYFELDGLNRLRKVRDDDQNILKRYDYQVRKAGH